MPSFRLQSTVILGTFGTDYLNLLTLEKIKQKLESFNVDYLIVKAHGDKEIKHDHFHWIIFPKNRYRFDIQSNSYFDIELEREIYSFTYDKEKQYYFKDELSDELFNEFSNSCDEWVLLHYAHPNIKGKKHYGTVYEMLNYVWEQKTDYLTNFDVEAKLAELKPEYDTRIKNKNKKKAKSKARERLFDFIRESFLIGMPKNECIKKIMQDPELGNYFIGNNASQNFLEKQFKQTKPLKPIPIFGKYYVPVEMYDFLKYLDNFTKQFYEEVILKCKKNIYKSYEEAMEDFVLNHKERGRSIIIKGKGGIGKTHLFACYGWCSYWKDRFNFDQWNNWGFFNWFDDCDIFSKSVNPETKEIKANDWEYLKTWIGGHIQSTFSGRYRATKTVYNYKPCVFITNTDLRKRFNDEALKYMDDLKIPRVNLDYKLYEKPDSRNMDNYSRIKEIDTRDTYYYKNIYKRKNENEEESQNKRKKTDEASLTIDKQPSVILIDSDSENEQASTSNNVIKNNYFLNQLENIKNIIHYYSEKLVELNDHIEKIKKNKERLINEYNNSFIINNKYSSIKDLEETRFYLMNEIRIYNDLIFNYEKLVDNYCDIIEYYVLEFTHVESFIKYNY